jgi:cytochrome c oxidase cbb3-type subunit I/II
MAAGMFYWMVPRLYGTKLHSKTLADYHFWLGTVGIVLYVISMWVAGINQGLMLRAEDASGGLAYPSFLETLLAVKTMYWVRLAGGTMYFVGMLMMAYNLVMTVRSGRAVDGAADVPVREAEAPAVPWGQIVFSAPVILVTVVGGLLGTLAIVDAVASVGVVTVAFAVGITDARCCSRPSPSSRCSSAASPRSSPRWCPARGRWSRVRRSSPTRLSSSRAATSTCARVAPPATRR